MIRAYNWIKKGAYITTPDDVGLLLKDGQTITIGSTWGVDSGIRSNAGTLQFKKDTVSAWQDFASGAGTGDVVGPASATDSNFAAFDTTTGKLIKDSGVTTGTFATAAQGALADSALQPTGVGSNLTLARVAGSTYSSIQDMQNLFHSAGVGAGGGITDDTDGTITVAAGSGFIRATDSATADIVFFDWAAESGANVALATNSMNYIYAEYNAGSPRVIATATKRTEENTNVFLGTVYRYATTEMHITEGTKSVIGDRALKMLTRMKETTPFARVSGGIVSATGTRNVAITAGEWWEGLDNFTTAAVDTSGVGTFIYFYQDGIGGWTQVLASTQIDNLKYDDGSGTLATLSNAKFGVHWLYLGADGDFYCLYGTVNGTLTEANDAGAPTAIPPHFSENHTKLVGKIVILKSASTFTSIQSAFNGQFSFESASDHGNLVGLGDDDHTQYALLSSQAGAPVSTPTRVGQINIDTTSDIVYVATGTASSADWTVTGNNAISATEYGYLNGVTSAIQTQLDAKASITKRVGSTTSSATPTINTDEVDAYHLTAQAVDITSFTTNLSGTPTDFQQLRISVTGTAARSISDWGASFENGTVALPTGTVGTTRLDVLLEYSTVSSKWRCMAAGSTA